MLGDASGECIITIVIRLVDGNNRHLGTLSGSIISLVLASIRHFMRRMTKVEVKNALRASMKFGIRQNAVFFPAIL
jgi:hypothetical protein